MKYFVLVLSVLALVACRDSEERPAYFTSGLVESTSKTFRMPKSLKAEIDKRYVENFRETFEKDLRESEEILANVPRDFLDVTLYLWQSRPGTLKDNYKYQLVRGGGSVDLGRAIVGKKGSIYLQFELNRTGVDDETLDQFRVYHYSNTKQKKIDGSIYGAGCGKLVDITDRLTAEKGKIAVRANVTDNRHVPALSGVYYFIHFAGEVIHLAAMSMEDSRFQDQKCR